MAHIGSFVPAKSALFGKVDRLYSRLRTAETQSREMSSFMLDIMQASLTFVGVGEREVSLSNRSLCLTGNRQPRSPQRCVQKVSCCYSCITRSYDHLTQITGAVSGATRNSLVVLDEFGKATSPENGHCLLMSLINYIIGRSLRYLLIRHLLSNPVVLTGFTYLSRES